MSKRDFLTAPIDDRGYVDFSKQPVPGVYGEVQDHDHTDGCLCDLPNVKEEMTQDEELPEAVGGVA